MRTQTYPFLFVGNHPCLDFVNTQMIVRGEPTDLLESVDHLASWLVQAGLLTHAQWEIVKGQVGRNETRSLLEQAKRLRATLRLIVERIAAGKAIPDAAVEDLNHFLSRYPSYSRLIRTKGGFKQDVRSAGTQKDGLLASLVKAAGDLLCLADPALIKKCRNAACILYFYDTTKNHSRNWCSMQLCGNRMKVAAFLRRKRTHAAR